MAAGELGKRPNFALGVTSIIPGGYHELTNVLDCTIEGVHDYIGT